MTIFRSELTCAALLAATAASVAAQNPPIQRPIQQAQQAAGQQQPQPQPQTLSTPSGRVVMTSSTGDPLVQGQAPATHTVREGDTLWALAQQYLGDPLLWPEIYRLNTNVVEDPHWIYPGEELRISGEPGTVSAGTDTTVVVQSVTVNPTPADTQQANQQSVAPASTSGPTIFSQMGTRRTTALQTAGARAYRAVREGEYYSAGFLTENQPINSGRIIGNIKAEMRGSVRTRTSAQLYEDVMVEPPTAEILQRGDMLLAFRRQEEVGSFGEMVIPTALLVVKAQNGGAWVATVVRLFGSLTDRQEIIKVQPFVNNSSQRAVPVTGGVQGRVIRVRDDNDVAQMQNALFIDKGANHGLRLGDIVQIYVTRPDSTGGLNIEQDQARAIIVNTRANTATAIIVELYQGDVGAQSLFRQIRRMPS